MLRFCIPALSFDPMQSHPVVHAPHHVVHAPHLVVHPDPGMVGPQSTEGGLRLDLDLGSHAPAVHVHQRQLL